MPFSSTIDMDEIVSVLLDGIPRLIILSRGVLKMAVRAVRVLLGSAGRVELDQVLKATRQALDYFKLLKHLLSGVGALTSVG